MALHGNGGGGHRFELCRRFFEPGIDFRAPTLPGFADVALPHSLRSLYDFSAYLHDYLLTLERPVVLLGHGIGGSLALEFCRFHEGAIDGIILHTPVGARLRKRLFARVMSLPGVSGAARDVIANPVLRSLWSRLFFDTAPPAAFADRFFLEYGQCQAFSLMFELITPRWFESLPVFPELPACILWGSCERLLSPEQIAPFKRLLPRSQVEIVDGWNHFPMVDHPQEYTRVVSRIAAALVAQRAGEQIESSQIEGEHENIREDS